MTERVGRTIPDDWLLRDLLNELEAEPIAFRGESHLYIGRLDRYLSCADLRDLAAGLISLSDRLAPDGG